MNVAAWMVVSGGAHSIVLPPPSHFKVSTSRIALGATVRAFLIAVVFDLGVWCTQWLNDRECASFYSSVSR
jgi:hypothetical protein